MSHTIGTVAADLTRLLPQTQVLSDPVSLEPRRNAHGVGLLKIPGARAELGPRVLEMHRSIKRALDPTGVLNPGKAF